MMTFLPCNADTYTTYFSILLNKPPLVTLCSRHPKVMDSEYRCHGSRGSGWLASKVEISSDARGVTMSTISRLLQQFLSRKNSALAQQLLEDATNQRCSIIFWDPNDGCDKLTLFESFDSFGEFSRVENRSTWITQGSTIYLLLVFWPLAILADLYFLKRVSEVCSDPCWSRAGLGIFSGAGFGGRIIWIIGYFERINVLSQVLHASPDTLITPFTCLCGLLQSEPPPTTHTRRPHPSRVPQCHSHPQEDEAKRKHLRMIEEVSGDDRGWFHYSRLVSQGPWYGKHV